MPPKIAVLLAGYNGQKYIQEQVLSLISQKKVLVEIFIRVDGESEIFIELISRLAKQFNNIHYIKGDVISSSWSNFYNLILGMSPNDFDYYAFCDQDDIWLDNKLINAISCFDGNSAQGYSSAFSTFNSAGKKITYQLGSQTKFDYFFQSAGPGCTFVLNNAGFDFLQSFLLKNPSMLSVSAHDWLVYFIFRFNNMKWIIDTESYIYYRQHSSNVAGVNKGIKAKFKRVKILFHGWYFSDLMCLLSFAKQKNNLPGFYNAFQLRRSKIQSVFIWVYFWLYIVSSKPTPLNSPHKK
jgi:rhamnosyltransferase